MRRFLCVVFTLVAMIGIRSVGDVVAAADDLDTCIRDSRFSGGLIVHAGCGSGQRTAELGTEGSFLVHGLHRDPTQVEAALRDVKDREGTVSFARWDGRKLPYIDRAVNVLIVDDAPDLSPAEMRRVLVPGGLLVQREASGWTQTSQPHPQELDEWTHCFYDASNNPVSGDTEVGPPRRLQWDAGPSWTRHHEAMSSVSAVVSAGGRLFWIVDEGPQESIDLAPRWVLRAQDAFNGKLLWKLPIDEWWNHRYPLKSGPAHLPRRVVADRERVYVTLGITAPVSVLDAATGETILTCPGTERTGEILHHEGTLFLAADLRPDGETEEPAERARPGQQTWKRVLAVDPGSGRTRWQRDQAVLTNTLATDGQRVYGHDGQSIFALSADDGSPLWQSAAMAASKSTGAPPSLMVEAGVVVFLPGPVRGNPTVTAVSAENGKTLWSSEVPKSGYRSPLSLFVIDDAVWSGTLSVRALQLSSGDVLTNATLDRPVYIFPHQRCYPARATKRYLLNSQQGIEYVDVRTGKVEFHNWVRGACLYGIMPANGLVYAPPHSCACYAEGKLNGLNALAPGTRPPAPPIANAAERHEKGPGYTEVGNRNAKVGSEKSESLNIPHSEDWPTYRHDAARSGATGVEIGPLSRKWQALLGGRLSAPVIAGGRVLLTRIDQHEVVCLDASSGQVNWRFRAGGRVDSPPTLAFGQVYFGCADGFVYCLNAEDGAMVWRLRGALEDQRLVSRDQLESVWPVHGSVLVVGEEVYAVAGRSAFLDGGLRLLRIDARTGQLIDEVVLDDKDPETGKNLQLRSKVDNGNLWWGMTMPVASPDVLSYDGRFLNMRSQRFELNTLKRVTADLRIPRGDTLDVPPHLFSPAGFLDDHWHHRNYWQYGWSFTMGWFIAGHYAPAGRVMAMDAENVYGFGPKPASLRWTFDTDYHLFAAAKSEAKPVPAHIRGWGQAKDVYDESVAYRWSRDVPVLGRAMALAGQNLLVAGPPPLPKGEGDWKVNGPGKLVAVQASDGTTHKEIDLASAPVWDGLAVAHGKLFVACMDGSVLCLN